MKERLKSGISSLKQRTRFFQGLAVGLVITSALTYAAVTITTFTSGTTISSGDVNANFSAIKAKIDQLDIGFVAGLSTDFSLTACSTNYSAAAGEFEDVVGDTTQHNDGSYDVATGEYTFSENGIYRIFVDAPNTLISFSGWEVKLAIYKAGTWTTENLSFPANLIRKFGSGQKVKIKVACSSKFPNSTTIPGIVDYTKYTFALKKF